MSKRIAIITTHPIQYYAPLFKLLAKEIGIKVFYTWGKNSIEKFDPGFGKTINWDVPLLDGYEYDFLENTSPSPGSHNFKGIVNPNIIKSIEAYSPSAILVFGWSYNSHLKVLRHFKGKVPVYFRGDSTLLDNKKTTLADKVKLFCRKLLLHSVYRHVDKVFHVGSASKAYFKWVGLKENQLVFAPHAIDNVRFEQNCTSEALAKRAKLGIPENAKVILFAGKLEPKKNPQLLLKVFLASDMKDAHLIFIGNGILEQALKVQAAKAGKQALVHFVGFQNQSLMPMWYNLADVFCLPSQGPGETWGLAVNEAMACGKAIITSSKVGCAIDLVKESVNGWVFETEARLQTIFAQLPSKQALEKMGARSKQIIEQWALPVTASNMLKEWEQQ
ncbi:glycosyltransferase family 4 protein [Parasediminibacterium sp. JCM 36343]|uniref:glycosyltransferase family 4 protein n=1 Tax=Parasediminibacterium sp. JCM 36343 TaxID=3374279 RepID=UPI00397BEE00